MNVVKYRPLGGLKAYDKFFDAFFNGSIADFVGSDTLRHQPSVNIIESEDNFVIEVAAPGLEKKDLGIQVDNGTLVLSASKTIEKEDKKEHYTRREFNYTSFNRQFLLPNNVNTEKITAGYANGVLSIHLPKASLEEKPGVRKVEIV